MKGVVGSNGGMGDIYILRGERWRFAFDTWRMNGQEIELLDGWMDGEREEIVYTRRYVRGVCRTKKQTSI